MDSYYILKATNGTEVHIPQENYEVLGYGDDQQMTWWGDEDTDLHCLTYQPQSDLYTEGWYYSVEQQLVLVDNKSAMITLDAFDNADLVIVEDDKPEETATDVTVPTTPEEAKAWLEDEMKFFGVEDYEKSRHLYDNEMAVAYLFLKKSIHPTSAWVRLAVIYDGMYRFSIEGFNTKALQDVSKFADLLKIASGIACKWEALHMTDDSDDNVFDEQWSNYNSDLGV